VLNNSIYLIQSLGMLIYPTRTTHNEREYIHVYVYLIYVDIQMVVCVCV